MDATTIEETNRIRISLGLKPLPVPGASAAPRPHSDSEEEEDPGSTLESRQAQAYDNYKQAHDAEEAKLRRQRKAAAAKKAREAAQRFALLDGQGLGDDGDEDIDAKAWLIGQKKRQKKIEKTQRAEEERAAEERRRAAAREHTAQDLAGVKVAHDMGAIGDGDEQILTLKDATIDENEAEGDELENVDLREAERTKERQDLKKRRPGYNPLDDDEGGERTMLGQYDEEIYGKKTKKFTLGDDGDMAQLLGELGEEGGRPARGLKVNLDMMDEDTSKPSSDYLDMSEIKIKKPKKSKSKKTRQRAVEDEEDVLFKPDEPPAAEDDNSMDVDASAFTKKRKVVDDTFVDDEDLQAALAIHRQNALKKRKKMRPEDIARQLKEAAGQGDGTPEPEDGAAGLVLGDITEFISGLQKPEEDEGRPRRPKPKSEPAQPSITTMDVDDNEDDDEDMDRRPAADGESGSAEPESSNGLTAAGVDQEKTFSKGIGSTLSYLKERKAMEDTNGAELNEQFRAKQEFLHLKRRLEEEAEEWIKQQRERDRTSGRLEKMSVREREEYKQQQNTVRDHRISVRLADLYEKKYQPAVKIEHRDDKGRVLDQKEAFKDLSHQFHGRGSGKGKTDKLLKKIADEKKREASSLTDASAGAGMSSAMAQQTKKRREAGVRLG